MYENSKQAGGRYNSICHWMSAGVSQTRFHLNYPTTMNGVEQKPAGVRDVAAD